MSCLFPSESQSKYIRYLKNEGGLDSVPLLIAMPEGGESICQCAPEIKAIDRVQLSITEDLLISKLQETQAHSHAACNNVEANSQTVSLSSDSEEKVKRPSQMDTVDS